jgi:hypothetical protein
VAETLQLLVLWQPRSGSAALYDRWALPPRFRRWVRLNSLLLKMFRPGFPLSASLMGEGSLAFAADLSALKEQILSRSHLGLKTPVEGFTHKAGPLVPWVTG